MLDASHVAHRTAAPPAASADGLVQMLTAASRFSLRVKGVPVPPRSPPPRGEGLRGVPPSALVFDHSSRPPPGPPLRSGHPPREGEGIASAHSLHLPINTCVVHGDRTLVRLGPDEWLLIGPEPDTETLASEIDAALADRFFALVDISHRNVAFEVSGPDAAAILNAGCPLDLHPRAFPAGSGTRTLLGKAEIVLMRPSDEPVFRVECWRSFATYVNGFLLQAARDV